MGPQQADVDAMRRSFLIGDISLGVGVVALGGSASFFLARTPEEPASGISARAPGSPVAYDQAVVNSAQTCDTGWHMCTAGNVAAAPSATPDTGGASINHTEPGPQVWPEATNTTCGNNLASSNLAGTSGCTPSGLYPDGYRLALSTSSWGHSHMTAVGCVPHATHVCAYPGGSAAAQYLTLCCR